MLYLLEWDVGIIFHVYLQTGLSHPP